MSQLFSALKIRDITLKNRIVVSPMCQYSSIDGFTNDWHFVHLGSRAVGGAGLIFMEATAVSPEGRISPDDLGIWKDEHIEGLKKIASFLEEHGAVPGIQLAHAGRKASHTSPWKGNKSIAPTEENGWQTVAPSAVPYMETDPIPEELSKAGMKKVIDDFKDATKRSLKAGFKIVEIHAAHGYLFHEFYSPKSNKRTDEYGGTFENRIRFLVETVEAVREVWPEEYPVFVRISATDWVEDGWTIDDSVKLAKVLKMQGVDLIDCSTGANVSGVRIPITKGYQVPFAEKIRKETGILTGAVGLITEAEHAEEIIACGKADVVLLAREFLRDPYFPLHAAIKLGVDLKWPVQYERGKPH